MNTDYLLPLPARLLILLLAALMWILLTPILAHGAVASGSAADVAVDRVVSQGLADTPASVVVSSEAGGIIHAGSGDTRADTGSTHASSGDMRADTGITHASSGDARPDSGSTRVRSGNTASDSGAAQSLPDITFHGEVRSRSEMDRMNGAGSDVFTYLRSRIGASATGRSS